MTYLHFLTVYILIVFHDFISDSTTSHLEELHETYGDVYDSMAEDDDFDALLRMCQKQLNG